MNYPAIAAIKSTLAAGNGQGQIIGAISAVQALASGFGPALFNNLYSCSLDADLQATLPAALSFTPPAVWWTGVLLMSASVFILVCMLMWCVVVGS